MLNSMAQAARSNILKHSILLLFCCLAFQVPAQTSELILPVKASFFTVDKRNNIYFINDKNEVVKYNSADSTQITYSNKTLGKPALIDVNNPMKILVFYPDYSTMVILDNTLSQISSLRLTTLNGTTACQPLAICRESESDFIWMYDALSRKLIRFDETGTIVSESEPFDELFEFPLETPYIFSGDNKVLFLDQTNGLYIFDIYGNYISAQYIVTDHVPFFNGQFLVVTDGKKVQGFDLSTLKGYIPITEFAIPVLECAVMNNVVYSLREDGIYLTR